VLYKTLGLNSYEFGRGLEYGDFTVKLPNDNMQRSPEQHGTIAPSHSKRLWPARFVEQKNHALFEQKNQLQAYKPAS
jgi:hypothetical protein